MPSHPFLPAARVGKYEVVAHIATGGMGAVYKAIDTSLGRTVALKVLAARLLQSSSAKERLRREARNAARLNHPNIVTLYEWGKAAGSYYLAMEFVEGPDLGEYILAKGKLDPEEARLILIQAVQALDHAYRQGVVHRDIKPSNFLLGRQHGQLAVKMTDLGLSRTVAESEFRVTRDGSTVGTVDYLSPEQSRDSRLADIRSDIYSLGCTFYHMLAGDPPFPEGGLGERVYKHLHAEPPDVRRFNRDVPPGLWAVLKKMLAKAPGARQQTPAELLHDLLHLPASAPAEPDERSASGRQTPVRRDTVAADADDAVDVELDDDPGLSTSEQRRAAAGQFERASEVLAAGDNDDYARHLLLSCLQLDPANLRYRKALRQIKGRPKQLLGRLAAPLKRFAGKTQLKMALRNEDYRKVLEDGELVLARSPGDIQTHLDMAAAAEAVGLPRLAIWLAEQARAEDPHSVAALRALARLNEAQGRYSNALRLWAAVRQEAPGDAEAQRKLNDVAAQETIERGNYTGRLRRGGRAKPPTDF
jgi:serine/threonine protein kinase